MGIINIPSVSDLGGQGRQGMTMGLYGIGFSGAVLYGLEFKALRGYDF